MSLLLSNSIPLSPPSGPCEATSIDLYPSIHVSNQMNRLGYVWSHLILRLLYHQKLIHHLTLVSWIYSTVVPSPTPLNENPFSSLSVPRIFPAYSLLHILKYQIIVVIISTIYPGTTFTLCSKTSINDISNYYDTTPITIRWIIFKV